MLIEQRLVSRKTPLDGKLEIARATALALRELGATFPLRTQGRDARARLVEMTCSCAKGGATGQHLHHFVESDVLRELEAGAKVRIEIDDARPGSLSIEPA